MTIDTIDDFLDYYTKLRARTRRVIECAPDDVFEREVIPGKWTFGDLVRHLAAIERHMYGETLRGFPSRYAGCGRDLADGRQAVLDYLDRMHAETIEILRGFRDEDLHEKCTTPAGTPITRWKWMRAMTEHEIHHRGQLYTYLALLGVATPPLFGLSAEDVAQRAAT
jgi:uncharacterized damage-inducible protein DinB